MEFRKIKNKNGEVLTTKAGKELVEARFEIGDTFIPMYNKVLEESRDIIDSKGKEKRITNYKLKCKCKDSLGSVIIDADGSDEIFVTLTPAQAKSIMKKAEDIELNQNLFVAYEYESENYGKQIGIGLKRANKPAKNFEDFD